MDIALGIGIAIGICGLGVGIGQGFAANGGLNAMARQPEIQKPISSSMTLALVFTELVFILAFVIGFLLIGKIPAPAAAGEKTALSAPAEQKQLDNNVPGTKVALNTAK